ncbi:MAG: TonB-dependent receptor [Pseudomonadota bacterium]
MVSGSGGSRLLAIAFCIRVPIGVLTGFSLAQAAPSVPSQPGESVALEEVLVTANRRVESLQETAMSVTAFTTEFIQDAGVNDLVNIEAYTPNLKITGGSDSRSTSIRIRGIGSVGTNTGIDPSVGLFIDGIYQGRAGMSISDLVDVERIEVLRGPQGTLYGKNTAAGAISIVTSAPHTEFESMLEALYDSNQRLELRGMVNLPLGDESRALRVSGFRVDGNHLFENTITGEGVNNAYKWGGRARLRIDTDTSEWLLSADYTREDTDCCAMAVSAYDGLSPLNTPITDTPSAALQAALGLNAQGQPILQYQTMIETQGFAPPAAHAFGNDYWFDASVSNAVDIGGLGVEWNRDLASGITLTAINGWRHYRSDSAFDGDFTAYDAVVGDADIELNQFSSELRLTSPGGDRIDYQLGLYAFYSELDSVGRFASSASLLENIGLGIFFPTGSLNTDDNRFATTSYAAFGQVVWNLSDTLSATLGLRYTREEKAREGSQITTPETVIDIPPVVGPDLFFDDSRTDDDLSPKLSLRYFARQDLMFYGTLSRGFKSGGYNQRRERADLNGEFDEEQATNVELGWKGSWLNRQLQLNGTVFYVEYDDFQAQTFDGSALRVTNAGQLESYGLEMDAAYLPTASTLLGLALGYNEARYDSFDLGQCTVEQSFVDYYILQGAQGGSPGIGTPCVQDLAGEPLDNAPQWTVSSFVQYERALLGGVVAVARLEHNFIDSFFLDQDLDPNLHNDSVQLLNARLTLRNMQRDWEVVLWGRNLLDEEYYSAGIDIPTIGGFAGIVALEASYGVTLRWFQ